MATRVIAKTPKGAVDDAGHTLAEFFRTQGAAVAAHLDNAKTLRKARIDDVFDAARWDRVLTVDVLRIALGMSVFAGRSVMAALGFGADDYDVDRTRAWLAAHASGVASGINGVTRAAVIGALRAHLSADKVGDLFESFAQVRAPQIARTEVTAAAGFGTHEAGHQSGADLIKTWHTGARPRSTHARIDGETRPLRAMFSIGGRWPGDSLLPEEERARCNCQMSVTAA